MRGRHARAAVGGTDAIGAPSPDRLPESPADDAVVPALRWTTGANGAGASAGVDDDAGAGVPVVDDALEIDALEIGAPRPAAEDVGVSDHRLPERAGGVPRAASGSSADTGAGDPAGVAADDAVLRWATGARAGATGGATVSGRTGGVTVCEAATGATCRTGAGSGSTDVTDDEAASGATPGSDQASADPADGAAARRWTCRVGIAALEVRLGTGATCAATSPAGAVDTTSWPSGCTIGESGRFPGTVSRNGAVGATRGVAPTVRWMGGSVAHAPVGGASAAIRWAVGASAVSPAGPPSDSDEGPSDGVLRPNGQDRRTGYSSSVRRLLIRPISSTNRSRSGCSMSRIVSIGQWK